MAETDGSGEGDMLSQRVTGEWGQLHHRVSMVACKECDIRLTEQLMSIYSEV